MQYTRYSCPDEFLKLTGPVFLKDEALYGLMYSCSTAPELNGEETFLAVVEDRDRLVLAAVMTPGRNLQLCSPGTPIPEAVALLAAKLREEGAGVPGVMADPLLAEMFALEWKQPFELIMNQRIHRLKKVNPVSVPSGSFRKAEAEHLPVVDRWAYGFHSDCFHNEDHRRMVEAARKKVEQGALFLWFDPEPVSMAARVRPTVHGEFISLVYTPPENRGKGYATALVAGLSGLVLEEGRKFCALYTDLSNPVSNSIYRKIGYVTVADVVEIKFQ